VTHEHAQNDVIAISVPIWIDKSDPDHDWFLWCKDKLAAAGWDLSRAEKIRGCIAVSMRIATPPPPSGLSKRKQAALTAGEKVWRDTGLPATTIADILLAAMGLGCRRVVQLHAEKVFTSGPPGRIDITITRL